MFFTPIWNWLKLQSRTSKQRRRLLRKSQRRPQLFLETLEDRTLLTAWNPIGPAPIVSGQTAGGLAVSGRVTGVATDTTDANTIFSATAGGGVWKTTNDGSSWSPLTDNLTDSDGKPIPLFMGAIAETRDGSSNEIVYAGTGEANNSGDSFYGEGILVSKDGGATWTLTNAGGAFSGETVSKIVIDPSDSTGGTAYAAVAGFGVNGTGGHTGIWKTTDFGQTWTDRTVSTGGPTSTSEAWSDVVVDPHTPTTVYAAMGSYFGGFGGTGNGVYKSTNGGSTLDLA